MRERHVADNVLDQHNGAFDDHAEVQCSEREQVRRNMHQVQTSSREQQGKRNRGDNDDGSADIAQKQEQNERDEDHPLGQVVKHRVGREANQTAAINERNDLHPPGQNVIVHLLNSLVKSFKNRVRIRTFPQEHDAGNDVVVIDDLAVFAMDSPGELAQTDFRSLLDDAEIFDAERGSIPGEDYGLFDVMDAIDQADFANVNLLRAFLNEAAAGVGIVVGELLLDLREGQPVGDELIGIETDLVFARGAAEAGYVDNVGNGFEIFFDDPVLERLQFHRVVGGIVTVKSKEINLANRAPVGAHLRIDAGWQCDLGQALEDALAIPGVVGTVFEDQLQVRKTE